VLVCRLFYFLKFSCCPGKSAPAIREALCNNEIIQPQLLTVGPSQPPAPR
jgi:hypothetical protein